MEEMVKIAVTAPESHADIVRKALGDAGAGKMGDYTHSSFSVKGIGRYMPTRRILPLTIKLCGIIKSWNQTENSTRSISSRNMRSLSLRESRAARRS